MITTLRIRIRAWAILAALALSVATRAAEFHVAPGAGAGGIGSPTDPWSLATALAMPAALRPGDTIWPRLDR
ncbi:MAG: hypothetical protein H0V44_18190 [Planctomycetes bacterium]|nr:hypothetical protein [Planctomycetota bacterium]